MSIPSIITGIRVTNILHDNKWKIVWNPAIDSTVTHYNVYRSKEPFNNFTKIIQVLIPDTTYFDSLPADWENKTVFYKVTATNPGGESDLTTTQATTDTDTFKYMYAPYKLKVDYSKYYEWLYNVVPTGSTNGTNKIFYLKYNYLPGSLEVSVNGVRLLPSKFSERTSNSVLIDPAPASSSVVQISFVKF